jgi:hypothetical protein
MAMPNPPDEVESAASVAHRQGQLPLEPAAENATQQGTPISVLDTSDTATHNRMTSDISETLGTFYDSYSELDVKFSSSSADFSFPKRQERTSSSERPLESPTAIIKEGTITTSEHSLHGTRLDGSAASISEHDQLPANINVSTPKDTASQPTPSQITREVQADASIISSAVSTGTSKELSRNFLLKGMSWLCFAFPPALILQFRYFPRIFVPSSLQ